MKYTKEDIRKEYIKGKSLRYSESSNEDIKSFIDDNIKLDLSHKEKVYCFLHDVIPKCKCCGKLTSFNNFVSGFKETCSNSCSVKLNKQKQEVTRKQNTQEKVKNLSTIDIVNGLYSGVLQIQKWREIEKLKQYRTIRSLDQLYKHVVLGLDQLCPYCNKVLDIDHRTKLTRKCTCSTKQERLVIDNKHLGNKDFLEFIIRNNLHYYSGSKNKIILSIYFSKFKKESDNFMEQLNIDCSKYGIPFFGYFSSTSKAEYEILEFIRSVYSGEIKNNDRSLGKEIDIYIPEKKLGIEFNGLYWHSSAVKENDYHLKKTELAESKGIQLLHIYEDIWRDKQEIIKSMIKVKLGIVEHRIPARKCFIKELSFSEAQDFMEMNHIQGSTVSKHRYGLFYKDELLEVLTFGRTHRSKDRYMELKRSCTKLGYLVQGGFSKLLKYAISDIKEDIITFADRSFSSMNNVYHKNGFTFLGVIPPGYKYNVNGKLETREKYQKHKLSKLLRNFDPSLTEKENMHNHGYYEVYDSGNLKYLYKYTKKDSYDHWRT